MALRDKKLSLDAKTYIVRALACRERPADVLAHLQEHFNVIVDRKALAHYDPRLNATLDADLKKLYEKEAAEFWDKKNFEPLNSLNVRQRLRMELFEQAGQNRKLKLDILEQAAKDEGGLFCNRREITGAEGAPLVPFNLENVTSASNEDIARVIADFPLSLTSPDVVAHMLNMGWISEERAGEADVEYIEFIPGDWRWQERGRFSPCE